MDSAGLCISTWWQPGALALQLEADGQREELAFVVGSEISLAAIGPRMCVGYRPPDQTDQISCPNSALASSGAQCAECVKRSATLACMRCIGERCGNPLRRQSCIQPKNHAVYLAAYAPRLLKVGVARWERRRERVVEQGARAAFIIGQADGLAARRLEWQIKQLGIPDRLTPRNRLSAWSNPFEIEQLEGDILQALGEMQRRLVSPWWLADPEKLELPTFPSFYPTPEYIESASELKLRGRIESIAGQMLIVRSDTGQLLALSGRALPGYILRPLANEEQGEQQLTLAVA
jgi:hypothetical protein